MSLVNSIIFRVRRLLGYEMRARTDLMSVKAMRRWRAVQKECSIEVDLEVRGRSNALDCLNIDSGVAIDRSCIIWIADESGSEPKISLGEGVYVGPFSYLGSYMPLIIGKNTIIGAYSYLITGNHQSNHKGIPIKEQGYVGATVNIGENVWLGCHVVILPGVTIGDGAIVGAGAVVTRDIPPGETWGGVPAAMIASES